MVSWVIASVPTAPARCVLGPLILYVWLGAAGGWIINCLLVSCAGFCCRHLEFSEPHLGAPLSPQLPCSARVYLPVLCPSHPILLVTAALFLPVTVSDRPLPPSSSPGLRRLRLGRGNSLLVAGRPPSILVSLCHHYLFKTSVCQSSGAPHSNRTKRRLQTPYLAFRVLDSGPQSVLSLPFPSLSPPFFALNLSPSVCRRRSPFAASTPSPPVLSFCPYLAFPSGPTVLSSLLTLSLVPQDRISCCHLSPSSHPAPNLGITLSTLFTRLIATSACLRASACGLKLLSLVVHPQGLACGWSLEPPMFELNRSLVCCMVSSVPEAEICSFLCCIGLQ